MVAPLIVGLILAAQARVDENILTMLPNMSALRREEKSKLGRYGKRASDTNRRMDHLAYAGIQAEAKSVA